MLRGDKFLIVPSSDSLLDTFKPWTWTRFQIFGVQSSYQISLGILYTIIWSYMYILVLIWCHNFQGRTQAFVCTQKRPHRFRKKKNETKKKEKKKEKREGREWANAQFSYSRIVNNIAYRSARYVDQWVVLLAKRCMALANTTSDLRVRCLNVRNSSYSWLDTRIGIYVDIHWTDFLKPNR